MRNAKRHDQELSQLYDELVDEPSRAWFDQHDPIIFGLVMRFFDGDVHEIDEKGNLLNIPPDAEREAAIASARAWVASGKRFADWLEQPAVAA